MSFARISIAETGTRNKKFNNFYLSNTDGTERVSSLRLPPCLKCAREVILEIYLKFCYQVLFYLFHVLQWTPAIVEGKEVSKFGIFD